MHSERLLWLNPVCLMFPEYVHHLYRITLWKDCWDCGNTVSLLFSLTEKYFGRMMCWSTYLLQDDVQSLLKTLQLSTRQLHHMCGHSKVRLNSKVSLNCRTNSCPKNDLFPIRGIGWFYLQASSSIYTSKNS